jgi:DNA-binding GntR family transcriptional regulator
LRAPGFRQGARAGSGALYIQQQPDCSKTRSAIRRFAAILTKAVRMTMNMPGSTRRHIVSFTHRDVRRRRDGHHRLYELILSVQGWRALALMKEHVVGLAAMVS